MSKGWSLRPNATREERRALQELARHAMITRLMEDIKADMMVCSWKAGTKWNTSKRSKKRWQDLRRNTMARNMIKIREKELVCNTMLSLAENNGMYCVPSDLRGVYYISDDDELAVMTSSGYFKMKLENVEAFAEELKAVGKDCRWRRTAQLEMPVTSRVGLKI